MLVLEDLLPDVETKDHSLEMLGVSLVSIHGKTHNIIFRKGIGLPIVKTLIKLFKKKIIQKKEGKLIELLGNYTVYIHFFQVEREIVSIFYINEKDKLIEYNNLCLFSNKLLKKFCLNAPISEINCDCNSIVPALPGISALFIIGDAGHSYFNKINDNQTFLAEHYIQIGGFISAILSFSKEVICKQSGGNLRAINFENQEIYMMVKDEVIFAYLIDKKADSESLKRYIELLIEEFLDLHRERIKNFNGDLTPFNDFESIVNQYFII